MEDTQCERNKFLHRVSTFCLHHVAAMKAGEQTTNVPNYHYHRPTGVVILVARESTCLKNKQIACKLCDDDEV